MSYKISSHGLRHKMAKLLAIGAFISLSVFGVTAQADVVFEETFDNGVGQFSESGRVYTGSYGVRLRGGASGTQITSPTIDASNFTGLSVSFDRSTSGLDFFESGTAAISVNGGSFATLESTRTASGRFSLNLPASVDNASSIVLRFSVDASSFFETYEVDNVVIEGNPGDPCEPGEPGCPVCPDPTNPECDDDNDNVPVVPIATLMDRAEGDGDCSVSIERPFGAGSTFYIPSDPGNPNAQFNVLVWGNGTGGGSTTYETLLESVATHCIAVAAANTSSSGSGADMEDALQELRSRYPNLLLSNHRVCTAGHSQGGGGSFNAANRIDADCVIPVQADTRFTVQIEDPLDPDVEVIALWGSSDTLAPASGNRGNVKDNSSILTQVETRGEGHFAPASGRGGTIGTVFRMANIGQLSNDSTLSVQNRRAFFGPVTASRIIENTDISDFRMDSGAENVEP